MKFEFTLSEQIMDDSSALNTAQFFRSADGFDYISCGFRINYVFSVESDPEKNKNFTCSFSLSFQKKKLRKTQSPRWTEEKHVLL